jgi:lysozyme family protein
MTEIDILDGILAREGGHRPEVERPNGSVDPETLYGITWDTYQRYIRRVTGLSATREGFRALPLDTARAIYRLFYIEEPGFTHANIPFEPLRVQLIDFGVNSGPARAIRWLQRVIYVEPTGTLNDKTLQKLRQLLGDWSAEPYFPNVTARLVNDALVAARSYMIDQAVDQGSVRKLDEEGLESRALSFFLARA